MSASKYPKIIYDTDVNLANKNVNAIITNELLYDLLHHTHEGIDEVDEKIVIINETLARIEQKEIELTNLVEEARALIDDIKDNTLDTNEWDWDATTPETDPMPNG